MICEDPKCSEPELSDSTKDNAKKLGGLVIKKQINQANFGVFLAHSATLNRYFALKVFPYLNDKLNPFFLNEVRFAGLDNKNIILTVHYEPEKSMTCRNKQLKVSYLVMELAPYGDFFDVLMTRRISFDEKLARTYFRQLIEGLEYLHSNGITHLDIKPENLLLGDKYQLKIADFDHSFLNGSCFVPCKGTTNFRAPEIANSNFEYLEAADIYSAAIMLFLFKTSGYLPHLEHTKYHEVDLLDLLNKGCSKFWRVHCEIQKKPLSFFDKDFRILFTWMTKADPRERATIKEIKASNWYCGPIYNEEELISIMEKKMDL